MRSVIFKKQEAINQNKSTFVPETNSAGAFCRGRKVGIAHHDFLFYVV